MQHIYPIALWEKQKLTFRKDEFLVASFWDKLNIEKYILWAI